MKWIFCAIPILAIAPITIAIAIGLMPSQAAAKEAGKLIPWGLTWGLILLTAGIAVALGWLTAVSGAAKRS